MSQEARAALAAQIAALARVLDPTDLPAVCAALTRVESADDSSSSGRLLRVIAQPGFSTHVRELLSLWKDQCPQLRGEGVALALQAAAQADQARRANLSVDLVWTGPSTPAVPVRRTEQVLLELIASAEQVLWVVSFAVTRVKSVNDALQDALRRQVKVRLVFESAEESEGRLSFDRLGQLAQDVPGAEIYVWPLEKRPLSEEEYRGLLHAKCAIADDKRLLVSSANLTDFALALNMELGVLVTSNTVAKRVADHFRALVEREVLCRA